MSGKILVTGGLGFIGARLVSKLRAAGQVVTVLDNLSPQVHGAPSARQDDCDVVIGDVRDQALLDRMVPQHEIIVHLAADTGTGQSMYEIGRYADVNVRGTACVLEAVTRAGSAVERVILASSRAVYGEGKYRCAEHGIFYPDGRRADDLAAGQFEIRCPVCGAWGQPMPTDEAAPPKPGSVYAVTKHAQEQLVLSVTSARSITGIVLRIQNAYGPGQSLKNPYTGILSIFSNLMRRDEPIDVFEDGRESRDFVYVDDVADAFFAATCTALTGRHVFNVGSGEVTSVAEIATALKAIFCSASPIAITGRYRLGDIRHNFADLGASRRGLNFTPRHSLADGLRKFADWARTQPASSRDSYDGALQELRAQGLLK